MGSSPRRTIGIPNVVRRKAPDLAGACPLSSRRHAPRPIRLAVSIQNRRRLGQGFNEHTRRVDDMKSAHRDSASRVEVRDFSKDHTVTALTSYDELATVRCTTLGA